MHNKEKKVEGISDFVIFLLLAQLRGGNKSK
jgi:hypothetical protein